MSRLRVQVEGQEFDLDGREVHYLLSDGRHLRLTTTPSDRGTPRQVGYFVTVLGRWFFHADNVPAARVLRIDGQPITNVRQELRTGRTTVSLVPDVYTGPRRRRQAPAGTSADARPRRRGPFQRSPAQSGPRDGRKYVIGRAGTHADIEIDDPLVSVRHATLRVDGRGRWWIAGPIYVDGVKQMSATLSEGDVFVIGKTVVTVSRDLLPAGERPGGQAASPRPVGVRPPTNVTGLAVEMDRVTVYGHEGNTRLDQVSLSIEPGEVVAVVGPSGAGKSSLINVLLGELPETAGTVHIGPGTGGRTDPGLRRRLVRYVPQGEALYDRLTVRETLTFAARLRAARDTSPREIADRVNDVLARLSLEDARERRIGNLSGGQRRRVSIGLELVGDPKLLLLDEPTSGLDPGKDRAIMRDVRQVSDTYHCTVIVVTHATEHLGYVHKLVVIAKGGRVRYVGPPAEALATLGQRTWADLMLELDSEPPAPPAGVRARRGSARHAPATGHSPRGLTTLLSRQLTLLTRRGPWSHAALLLIPLLCTVIAVLASGDGLRPGPKMAPVLAILVTVSALTGASLTYLDLVHDFEALRRDWRVGVEVMPMVLAKAIVFGAVCTVLSGVVTGIFALARHLPEPAEPVQPLLMLFGVILLIMLASMALGFVISAVSSTAERAVTGSTQLAVLQVTLSGALFHLKWGLGVVAGVLPARLGLAAVASYADLNPYRKPAELYEDWMWAPGAAQFWVLTASLVLILAGGLAAATWRLQRRWRDSTS